MTLCKGYRPEARGYVIYSPRALPERNKSHNPSLQADNRYMLALVAFTSFLAF